MTLVTEKLIMKRSFMTPTILAITVITLQSTCESRYFEDDSMTLTNHRLPILENRLPILEDRSSSLLPLLVHKKPIKRMLFDTSCQGIYDRELTSKLEGVCDACYNLYRKPYIATECRHQCFNNGIFESCLYDLMMHDVAQEYKNMVQYVGKK